VSLSPYLPHWQLAIYGTGNFSAVSSGKGFFILSMLLLAIFVTAIIMGGSLLIRQAYRSRKEALQKTSFVSNVSHELKTPVANICMYAENLASKRITKPEQQERYFNVILSEGNRLARVVNNVLDFSQLEKGTKKYHLEDLNLPDIIGALCDANGLRVHKAGMRLTTELSDNDIRVLADRNALGHALANLIDNAIKYAARGGELSISLVTHAKKECRVFVMDRGPGIPAEHGDKIFKKFHRLDDSLTASKQGCGLGLSIARSLVEGMGGKLRYEHRTGGGSVFIIALPLHNPDREDK
jgi:signal transduction histidine kinase